MILIIISSVLTLITIIMLGIKATVDSRGNFKEINFKFQWRMLGGFVWLLLILFGCFKSVKTGEVGIKTRFGKITDTYLNEGINFKLPYEKIEKVNIKVQKYENKDVLETSTKDMQIVNGIKVAINYQIDGTKAVDLYKRVGSNYKETVLEPAIQETIKSVISKYTAEELVTKRSEIAIDMQNTLNKKTKNYGINIVSIAINNFNFSASYNQAIEQKAVAEQQVETSKKQLEKSKVDAEKKKIEAQGEAEANKIKEKSLTKEIIQQQFIEKWDGKLPSVTSSNNIFDISSFIK